MCARGSLVESGWPRRGKCALTVATVPAEEVEVG